MKKSIKEKLSDLLGYIILGLFVISMICVIIGGKSDNTPLIMFGMGCMFLIVGSIFVSSGYKYGIPAVIFGLVMFSYSISEWFGSGIVGELLNKYFLFLFGLVFFLVGFLAFVYSIGIRLWKRHFRCNVAVNVKVIDSKRENNLYKSVYQYNYNGKDYTNSPNYYTNILPHYGEFIAYINPNNPEEIIIPLTAIFYRAIIILSLLFMAAGIFCMYWFITGKYIQY